MDFHTYLTEVLQLKDVKEVEIVSIEPDLPISFEKGDEEQ
jgi:hypothetical protein